MPREKGDRPDVSSESLDVIQSLKDENAELRAKLDRTQLLLNGLADVSPDIFWQTDENHRFTYFSPAVRTVCGNAVNAQLGKSRPEIAHGETDTDDWRRHFDDLRKLRPFKLFSYDIKHSSGEIRHVVTSGRPCFDDMGKFLGYVGIARDVTEQVAERNRLVATEENLLQAINALNASLTLWDADDRLITFNDHFRVMNVGLRDYSEPGITFEEHIRAYAEKRLKVEPDELENWVQWRLARHRNPREQFESEGKDGRTILVNEATFLGYRGIGRDITGTVRIQNELRAAKERAEQASRAKSEFLAHMSHELRTPLNAILGFSEIIKSQVFGPIGNESYSDYAQDIQTSGEHLLSLINDLLDLSKIEAGKFEILDEELDVAEMLEQTERYFRQRFAARGITHTIRVAPEAACLRADRRALSQLLFNLLSNAEKYNRENGRIETTVRLSEDGCCRITVTDTGFGFDATDYETAIAPFGRIENPMTAVSGGTGLGLPIVNGLMHLHGGSIDIESEMEVGTSVSLIFPPERVVQKDA